METNHNGMSDRDDPQSHEQEPQDHRYGSEETDLSINKEASADEEIGERKQERQHHGKRRYHMFRNHSSANDQPRTNTGPGIF